MDETVRALVRAPLPVGLRRREASSGGTRVSEVRHVSIFIARAPAEVYEFASDPRNLSRWAAGLARSSVSRDGDWWIAEAPFGRARIRFAEPNALGVMDHDVELESGEIVHNPMRVVPNGDGSELLFTLVRRPGVSDEELEADERMIESDLNRLKQLLEGSRGREASLRTAMHSDERE